MKVCLYTRVSEVCNHALSPFRAEARTCACGSRLSEPICGPRHQAREVFLGAVPVTRNDTSVGEPSPDPALAVCGLRQLLGHSEPQFPSLSFVDTGLLLSVLGAPESTVLSRCLPPNPHICLKHRCCLSVPLPVYRQHESVSSWDLLFRSDVLSFFKPLPSLLWTR